MIEVPLSPGDLADRLSILAIKLERLALKPESMWGGNTSNCSSALRNQAS